MSLGQDLAAGIKAGQSLFEPLAERKKQERELQQKLTIQQLKEAAALKKAKDLKLLEKEFAQQDLANDPIYQQITQAATPQQAPVQPTLQDVEQVATNQQPVQPTLETFLQTPQGKVAAQRYTAAKRGGKDFDIYKAFDDFTNDLATEQYLKAQGIDLPVALAKSPFASDIIGEQKEKRKIGYKTEANKVAQKILTDPDYRKGKKQLTDEDLNALAQGGVDIAALYKNDGSLDLNNATEAAKIVTAQLKPQQVQISIAQARQNLTEDIADGVGGRKGRSGGKGGGGGWKRTRLGGYVKVDKYGNPTGQTVTAAEAYNLGITNTPPPARKPSGVSGGGNKPPIPVPKIDL